MRKTITVWCSGATGHFENIRVALVKWWVKVNALTKATDYKTVAKARLISNIFHPWVVLVPTLALAAYAATSEPFECIKWTMAAFLPALLFPYLYAVIRSILLSRKGTQQKPSRSLFRNEPKQLLIMSGLFGIPSVAILYYLGGPKNLIIIILGITAVMLVISLINIIYRASFHLAMVTSMLTALWFLFGAASLVFLILLPILGFSRCHLGEHTLVQILTGFFVGFLVGGTVFYGLGLVT